MRANRVLAVLWAVLFVVMLAGLAAAEVPKTINYQGYLTHSSGQPVNGPVNLTFSIYDAASSGSLLWTETHTGVTVTSGVYSVVLGSGTPTPAPITLPFDAQYYLGITVGADPEMTPRQALTVSPYAFRAVRADNINSSSQIVSTVPNGTAPLSVSSTTVVQNLNADMVDDKHASELVDITSPQSISGAKTFTSTITGSISGNAATATQLAANPTDCAAGAFANAIDASGNLTCSTNGASLSGVNAATLNSLTSSEIIAAAADEKRTPISACGTTISTRGSYYVTQSLSTTGTCISITANDVTLDLMGFVLSGDGGASDYGILLTNASNVEIRNGTVRAFYHGIHEPYGTGTANSNRVINIKAISNTGSGIYLESYNNQITRCTCSGNSARGIFTHGGSMITDNTVSNNGTDGINVLGGYIANNNVGANNGSGIQALAGSTIVNNIVLSNQQWGIGFGGDGIVAGNTISNNNTSNTSNQGGLGVNQNSMVKDNVITNNQQMNLYVTGSRNTIENNLLANSSTGILATAPNNYYAGNKLFGNTTDFQSFAAASAMPITNIPFTITAPGYYYLTGNMFSSTSGITVNISNVTIDLNGFSIYGTGTVDTANNGIVMNTKTNVEIKNGTIGGFGYHGIWEQGAGKGHRIINVRVLDNKQDGIVLSGSNHLIKDSVVSGNVRYGINVAGNNLITGNTVFGQTASEGIATWGAGNTISGNMVSGNKNGIYSPGGYNLISGNTVQGNTTTNIISCGTCVLSNNVAP